MFNEIPHVNNPMWEVETRRNVLTDGDVPIVAQVGQMANRWFRVAGYVDSILEQQVQIEKKGKNKSREEIVYQMKVFFFRSVVGSVFCKSARCP